MRVLKKMMAGLFVMMIWGTFTVSESFAMTDGEALRNVFDVSYYYENNVDLQTNIGMNEEMLFNHFVNSGIREGRSGNAEFNLKSYIRYNPDLFAAFQNNFGAYCRHYLETGKYEGRICLPQPDENNIIGEWTTSFVPTEPRAVNITVAAQRIDGITVMPQEEFSFSRTVLSRTSANGYVLAPEIGGMGYGGGICQVSSTLYAAMCRAMLPAVERYPHSSRISYMPVGLDATISEGVKDLRFINIFADPVQIHCGIHEGQLLVSIELLKNHMEEETTESKEKNGTASQDNSEPVAEGPGNNEALLTQQDNDEAVQAESNHIAE